MHEMLTQRQARLRSAAVAALAGLALVQVIELPYNLAQARHVAALSGLVAIGCMALAVTLAAARTPSGGAAVWRFVAAAGALLAGGWALTRAVPVPGLESGLGRWTTAPGLASAGLGLACVVLAVAGSRVRPSLAGAVCLLKASALALALVPAAGVLLVALGPGPSGGENTISGAPHGHGHVHASAAAATFRPGFGGHAGHYIYPNATPPQLASWALALAVGAAALLTYLAAAALRRRSSPPPDAPGRSIATGPVPGALAGLLLVLVVLAAAAPTASAHATLLRSVPPAAKHVAAPPAQVRLTFSEPVQILRPSDVSVVDGRGRPVTAGAPRSDAGDARIVTIPMRRRLLPDSYTVRYRVISADSHDIDDALVFALGAGRLRAPVLRGAGGLSETGPWAVGARFAELTALGLLLGLLAFRSLT
ncbi:MAG: copper transport protein, partial [Thermoleophilaceae bacterium]|nr:copper transport protein [Thermoleophilaceae bacterium]